MVMSKKEKRLSDQKIVKIRKAKQLKDLISYRVELSCGHVTNVYRKPGEELYQLVNCPHCLLEIRNGKK